MHLQQDSTTPTSAQPVDWLVGKLDWGNTLRSWIPEGFESYVRILHPAYVSVREEGIEVARKAIPWSENGKRGHAPLQGQLDASLLSKLLGHLVKETASPNEIWMLVWTGFGGPIDTIGLPIEVSEQLTGSGRKYVLRRGAIVSSHEEHGDSIFEHAPSFWWPDDRAWFASSDIDSSSTYVGGSEELIEQIMNDSFFEAFPADLDDPYDGLLITKPPIINVRIGFRKRLRHHLHYYLFQFGRRPGSGTVLYREKRWWEWWFKP